MLLERFLFGRLFSMTFSIVSRAAAGVPTRGWASLTLPVSEVNVHHSVTAASDDPLRDARNLDLIAVGRGMSGISYSYLIHPNGTVVEGRGLYVGAHTLNRNSRSFGVCFIGNFENQDRPTPRAVEAFRNLVAFLQSYGYLSANPTIRPHSDTFATACPGRHLKDVLPELRRPLAPSSSTLDNEEEEMIAFAPDAKPQTSGPLAGRWAFYRATQDVLMAYNGATLKDPDGSAYGVPYKRHPAGHQRILGCEVLGSMVVVSAEDGGTFAYAR